MQYRTADGKYLTSQYNADKVHFAIAAVYRKCQTLPAETLAEAAQYYYDEAVKARTTYEQEAKNRPSYAPGATRTECDLLRTADFADRTFNLVYAMSRRAANGKAL